MSFNINTFRANGLVLGGARPSLFEVSFPNISNLQTQIPVTKQLGDQDVLFLVSAASIPAARVDGIPVYYFGRPIYLPGERTFDAWSVTVLNDEDYGLRDFFEAWSNQMNSLQGNLAESSDPSQLKVDHVTVTQWGKSGSLVRQYVFFGMFPVVVGDIQLSWDQGNRIETFDVRFLYDWWEPANSSIPDETQTAPPSYDPGDVTTTAQSLNSNINSGIQQPTVPPAPIQ